jgi:hypothetical protein
MEHNVSKIVFDKLAPRMIKIGLRCVRISERPSSARATASW